MITTAKIISDFYRENWIAGILLSRIVGVCDWTTVIQTGIFCGFPQSFQVNPGK
jgi:hypothetical protein